jgi:AraC-like DNA-binding protein
MKLTGNLTQTETLPDWARARVAAGDGRAASFGHTVISRVEWGRGERFLPLHDVLHFSFADQKGPVKSSGEEECLAAICRHGTGGRVEHKPLPSLRLQIERAHFEEVVREHFEGECLPTLRDELTFLRDTPHGRGLYALAAALWEMVEVRADLLSRYCLEVALIKAVALSPPNMFDLRHKGETWGPMLRRVERAAQQMTGNLQAPFSLAQAAKAAGCSTRSLNEAFQRHLQLSPLQFHRQCRLEAAYADLAAGGAKVTEVAMAYGFENLGRFARAFRDRFGSNPSELARP